MNQRLEIGKSVGWYGLEVDEKGKEREERSLMRIRREAKIQAPGIWWGGKAVGEGRGYSDGNRILLHVRVLRFDARLY